MQRVSLQLGYGVESLDSLVRRADIDDGVVDNVTSDEQAGLWRLEQENRELKSANEILKRAASFFGAELDRDKDDVVEGRNLVSSSSARYCR